MKKVLVVCAHPGDEVLGCGGTLARHRERGDDVNVMVLGDGWTSRTKSAEVGRELLDLDSLEAQGRAALAVLSVERVNYSRLPDNRFDSMALLDIIKEIERVKSDWQPDVIYTNSPYDLSVDQRTTCRAVLTAFRPQPGENRTALYAFETASSTEWNYPVAGQAFAPNAFVDISASLERKLRAYGRLASEVRQWPHARSIRAVEHRAHSLGASIGFDAAEAFVVLRQVKEICDDA